MDLDPKDLILEDYIFLQVIYILNARKHPTSKRKKKSKNLSSLETRELEAMVAVVPT